MQGRVDSKGLYKEIGRRIKAAREAASLPEKVTQDALAKAIDVTRVSVANYEGGSQAISISDLYEVAKFLDIEVCELLPPMGEVIRSEPEEKLAAHSSLTEEEKLAIQDLIDTVKQSGGNL